MPRAGRFLLSWSLLLIGASCTKRVEDPSMGFRDTRSTTGVPAKYRCIFDRPGVLPDEEAGIRAALPFDQITLERTGCYGSCPAYKVTFFRSGAAELDARAFMPQTGHFVGNISLTQYARLCYAVEKAGFASFKKDYRAPWTDDATCTISVAALHGERSVSDYGQVGPIELWLLQCALDNERQSVRWMPKSEPGAAPTAGAKLQSQ